MRFQTIFQGISKETHPEQDVALFHPHVELIFVMKGIVKVYLGDEEIEGVPMPVLMALGVDTSALDIGGTAQVDLLSSCQRTNSCWEEPGIWYSFCR